MPKIATEISTDNETPNFGSIHYKVVKNGAASKRLGREVFSASVLKKELYGTNELAERLARENSLLAKSAIKALISDLANLVGKLVAEGRTVNIGGVVRFMPVIHGNFDSADELFNPQKHQIDVKACVGSNLRKAARQAPATRIR